MTSLFAGQSALAAPNDPLCSADDFVESMGLGTAATDLTALQQARIETALEIASAEIRAETNQQLTVGTDTLTFQPLRGCELVLPEWPVTSIVQLVVDGTPMASGTDYVWTDRGVVTPLSFSLVWYGLSPRTIVVTYTHGWSPLPRDLAGVCLARARRWYDGPDARTVEQESLGQWSVHYATTAADGGLTPAEKYTLSRYASWTNGY